MEINKIFQRNKIDEIKACPGDTIQLSYKDKLGNEMVVAHKKIDKKAIFNEAVIFEGSDGDRYFLGGAFVGNKN